MIYEHNLIEIKIYDLLIKYYDKEFLICNESVL